MATGLAILQEFKEGDRAVTEDGPGVIRKFVEIHGEWIATVRLDGGGQFDYDLECLGEEIDVNRTCLAFGLCDGAVVGERRRPDDKVPEPVCAEHNRLADELQ